MTGRREARLADELEAIAAALRAGDAELCGYRVRRERQGQAAPERVEERGAVEYPGGWLSFRIEE